MIVRKKNKLINANQKLKELSLSERSEAEQ